MSLKAKLEAVIYATEEPVTLNQLATLLRDATLTELAAEEQTRLALNQTVSDGTPEPIDQIDESPSSESPADAPAAEESASSRSIPEPTAEPDHAKEQSRQIKAYLRKVLDELIADYSASTHGVEIRQIAGGYRMATKPEQHDVVVAFAKSLKPPVRLSLQALETLAVIAYKQPVTAPEIGEIRGVDSSGVLATLLDLKLITTAGRKQVIGRPILYKTTKEFLLRFGLDNVSELPSIEEFEKLGDPQTELFNATVQPEGTAPETPPTESRDSTTESSHEHVAVTEEPQSVEGPGHIPQNHDKL